MNAASTVLLEFRPSTRTRAKRHTSFASIDATPEVSKEINIEINEKDIEITTTVPVARAARTSTRWKPQSSCATCRPASLIRSTAARTQGQNRVLAFEILKPSFYTIEEDKQKAEADRAYGEKGDVSWGNQNSAPTFSSPIRRCWTSAPGRKPTTSRPSWTVTSTPSSKRNSAEKSE